LVAQSSKKVAQRFAEVYGELVAQSSKKVAQRFAEVYGEWVTQSSAKVAQRTAEVTQRSTEVYGGVGYAEIHKGNAEFRRGCVGYYCLVLIKIINILIFSQTKNK
jgi:hypothetical protein